MTQATLLPRARSRLGHDALRERVEVALRATLGESAAERCPPRLRGALIHAVFAPASRLRPTLCLAVAGCYGDSAPELSDTAATAVELVHCASLVHDDLPCFDDAALRRGQPTVHVAFGVPAAVLAGDALIVLAFGALARPGAHALASTLASATGPWGGIIAGQAWEGEAAVSLEDYHRAKTAALFEAAAQLGALSVGAQPDGWTAFGDAVGRAYQAADEVWDAIGACDTGKSAGRDVALGRPSAVRVHGMAAARRRVVRLLDQAYRCIPPCPEPHAVRVWLGQLAAKIEKNTAAKA